MIERYRQNEIKDPQREGPRKSEMRLREYMRERAKGGKE